MAESQARQSEDADAELSGATQPSRWAWRAYWVALLVLYLAAIFPRLRAAGFDEPDLTYGDERWTIGKTETLLREPDGKITRFRKPPGTSHFLYLAFPPYYWLVKDYFGWQSIDDVQWWRARRYWRSLNICVAGLLVILAGVIGAGAFNMRVGLIAAAFCATSYRAAVWSMLMKEEALTALACTLVVYCVYRLLRGDSGRLRWVLLAAFATGSAMAFKYNAAPVVPFFLLALCLFPGEVGDGPKSAWSWLRRPRIREILLYVFISVGAFLVWFPQLVTRPAEVRKGTLTGEQLGRFNVFDKETLSVGKAVGVAWATWERLFRKRRSSDDYPYPLVLLITAIYVAIPLHAFRRRDGFLLLLWFVVFVMYLMLYYLWLNGHMMNHYFLATSVPMFLMVGYGIDWLCGRWAGRMARGKAFSARSLRSLLIVLICIWPVTRSYLFCFRGMAHFRGHSRRRELRRKIVNRLPADARVFYPIVGLTPQISESFLHQTTSWNEEEWGRLADLARQGFDYVCLRPRIPRNLFKKRPYRRELTARGAKRTFILSRTSYFLGHYFYYPVQPPGGGAFSLGLYFREPSTGDFAGVRGAIPRATAPGPGNVMQDLVLRLRLFNGAKWWKGFLRWEVLVDGKPVWQGRENTEVEYAPLSLRFRARASSEILVRVLRTDYRQEATWGWGGPASHLKIDGLKVVDTATSNVLPVKWSYTGRNGGPGPARYAMRRDWFHNPTPTPLLDTDFEGEQSLVDAWRPHRSVDPRAWDKFPAQRICREKARIEKVAGAGIDGSNALRFIAEYPAKESTTLGIMQPICNPASRTVRKIRVHWRADGEADNRGDVELRFVVSALSLSGEYVDRAEVVAPKDSPPDQWHALDLDLERTWKRKHTRIDLIEFLEVTIEAAAGPRATFDYLIDKVELEFDPLS